MYGSGSNRTFAATDAEFAAACVLAEVPPTKRQASKFRMKRGRAYDAALVIRASTRECEGCGQRKPQDEMATVFAPGTGETYQCEQCRGGP